MIVEQRTYDIVPGKVPVYLQLYREFGIDVQIKHLGCLLGYYYTEFGDLNQVIHLWKYTDLNDRSLRRGKLFSDPHWHEFFNRAIPIILKQRSLILNSAPFVAPQSALVGIASA